MTVESDANYPQYLDSVDETGAVIPVTEENQNSTVAVDTDRDFSGGFNVFFAKVSAFLLKIVEWFRSFIEGIIGHSKG